MRFECRWCRQEGGLANVLRGALQRSKAAAAGKPGSPARRAGASPARAVNGVPARTVNGAAARALNGSPTKSPNPASAPASPGAGQGGRGRERVAGSGGPGKTAGAYAPPGAEQALLIVLVGNLIGIACARSLHFQFYAWCAVLCFHQRGLCGCSAAHPVLHPPQGDD